MSSEYIKQRLDEIDEFRKANNAEPEGESKIKGQMRVKYLDDIMTHYCLDYEQMAFYQKKYIDNGLERARLLSELHDLKVENRKLKKMNEWPTPTTAGENL